MPKFHKILEFSFFYLQSIHKRRETTLQKFRNQITVRISQKQTRLFQKMARPGIIKLSGIFRCKLFEVRSVSARGAAPPPPPRWLQINTLPSRGSLTGIIQFCRMFSAFTLASVIWKIRIHLYISWFYFIIKPALSWSHAKIRIFGRILNILGISD